MEIRKVGVLGCGLMGAGIAQTAASAGFEVVVREVSDELCERGFKGIEKSLAKFSGSAWPCQGSMQRKSPPARDHRPRLLNPVQDIARPRPLGAR